jgi:cyclic-di-AMP phosphodiesterase PgpH
VWPFKKKKIKHRRLEVRKDISSDVPSLWERFRTTGAMVSVLLGLGFWISAGLLDICPLDPLPYRQGQYLPGNVRARVKFEVLSPARLEDQVRLTRESTAATFVADEARVDSIVSIIKSLPGKLKTTTRPANLEDDLREQFALDDTALTAWRAMLDEPQWAKLDKITTLLKTALMETPLVSGDDIDNQMSRRAEGVILESGGRSRSIKKTRLIAQNDTASVTATAERLARKSVDEDLVDSLQAFLEVQLMASPLYIYDAVVTKADIARAEKTTRETQPLAAKDCYEPGQILVERTVASGRLGVPLEARELELLAHEHRAWLNEGSIAGLWARAAGRTIQILMVTVLLCVYIAKYQGKIVANHLRGLAVVIVLLIMLAISRTMGSLLDWNPHASVLTVVMISCVMAITYNQRFAMAIGSVQAVLVTMQLRGDFGMLIVMLAGVMPCVFLLREIRTRSKLIEVSAISAAVVFLAVWVRSWTGRAPWSFALVDGLWASGFALLAGFLVQGILPLIERAFKVATSMTLLEWCDASKPLLKRLATQAPGTYNHSLQLGMMCESAAETIGARGLLARVGAYYHDIGKTRKPEYFVENQGTMPSKHENLSPAMSLLIIVGHVKDGIEMAKECNLPTVLHEFIITHHGTTLVHHFYEEAARQRTAESDRAPDEVEFRYSGPKPSSKEAGILMLADVAESSVRSMEEPTPVRIESQVHSMVQRRLMDGQLDHCNLTLREVHAIETSLIKSLCGIYHARIAYPTPLGEKPAAAELPTSNGRNGNGNNRKEAEKKPDDATPQSDAADQDVSQDADS